MGYAASQRLGIAFKLIAVIAVILCGMSSAGCTGGGGSSSNPSGSSQDPISVSFSVPTTPTVSVQADIGTQNFTAVVTGDSQNKGVNFTLSGGGCSGASCGTLTGTTLTSVTYVAPATPPTSTVTLSASSVSDPSKGAAVTITVTPAVAVMVAPAGTQSVQADIGHLSFTASVAHDSQTAGVTWSLTGSGCSQSTCGTISASSSASGAPITYTAPAVSPNPANVTLTATSVTDKNQFAGISITITPAISVNISPANPVVAINKVLQLTASIANDAQNAGVTWSLNGSGSLSNQTSTTVTYTAPSTVPSSPMTLTATSVSDPAQSSTVTITVTPPIAVSIAPTVGCSVGCYYPVFANNSYPLQLNQSQSFTAAVQNDPNNLGVNWTLSGSDCSGGACGGLSDTLTTALYTAPTALPGTQNPDAMTLTATSIADPTASASVTIPISQGIPNAGPNAAPGWFEIPQTLLLPQCPVIGAIFGTDGCQGVIAAWGGGIADTTRNRLLFTGGGHENYAGNEVYALDLASSPTALVRINDPVFPSPLPTCQEDWGPPPTPSPRETYGNLAYISDSDKMWLLGGAPFATVQEPCRSGGMWTLDFSLAPPLWTELNQSLTINSPAAPATGNIDLGSPTWINGPTPTDINYADYLPLKSGDSLSGLVYVYISNADILASYNVSTNTLTSLSAGQVVPKRHTGQTQIRVNGVLDPTRHIFLIVGEGTMGWFDLNTLNVTPPSAPPFVDMSQQMGQGDCGAYVDPLNITSLQDLNSPGLAYDPVVDRVIGWAGGNTIYVIDTTKTTDPVTPTMSCKALTTYPGGPPQTPIVPAQQQIGLPTGAQYNGTFGRFRYFPGLDIFAVVNDWQQNAFTFRAPNPLPPGY